MKNQPDSEISKIKIVYLLISLFASVFSLVGCQPGPPDYIYTHPAALDDGFPNPIIFSSSDFPADGTPVREFVQWTPSPDYPAKCCVFAVVQSDNDIRMDIDNIIRDLELHNFDDLFSHLKTDNVVAQRNLHIEGTPGPSPGSGSSPARMLSWVQIDNPFVREAPASLDIDATQAEGLESLNLEVNDEIIDTINPGERKTVTIDNTLNPGDHRIIRFWATLPPSASVGMSFPIHLQFLVDKQLVSGYTHILRVVPFSEALLQVLDLYGSLRAVAVGCKSDLATPLANKALKNVLRERRRVSPGCLGLLWRLFRSENAWRSEVTRLSGGIAAVAQSLEGKPEPETQVIRRRLYELAGLLLTPKSIQAPIFIEQIRELADRIQEPAGRLARQQMQASQDK